MEKLTVSQALFNLFLWGVIFFTLYPASKYPYKLSKSRKKFGYALLLLFCLFPFFGGDYFHYKEIYTEIKVSGYSHLEIVYWWLIQNVCHSYFEFRLIIWGIALILTLWGYRRFHNETDLPLFYFGVFYLPWFSYARASLAMSMIFFGLSLLSHPVKRLKFSGYVIGIALLGLSVFFHKSAMVGIAAALGALFFHNPKKGNVVMIVLLFPVVLILIESFLSDFMSMDLTYDDFISGRQRDTYLEGEGGGGISHGLGQYISTFFTRVPLFIIAATYIFSVYKGYIVRFDKYSKTASSYTFYIMLIAIVFMFDLGYNTYTLYYRTLTFAMIPAAVFLTKMKTDAIALRVYRIISVMTIVGIVYTLLYSVYLGFVG